MLQFFVCSFLKTVAFSRIRNFKTARCVQFVCFFSYLISDYNEHCCLTRRKYSRRLISFRGGFTCENIGVNKQKNTHKHSHLDIQDTIQLLNAKREEKHGNNMLVVFLFLVADAIILYIYCSHLHWIWNTCYNIKCNCF